MTDWDIAIDLGATASAAAIRTEGQPAQVLEIDQTRTVPSCVLLHKGELVAGKDALHLARRYPAAAVHDPKRRVGGRPLVLKEPTGEPRSVPVTRALAALLKLFVDEGIRRHNGDLPSRIVLTHPALWNRDKQDVLRQAAQEVAGAAAVKLVPEAVAAAFHYATVGHIAPGGLLGVYDLGGGTLDTAVLRVVHGDHELLGRPGGDLTIGGNAFDHLVYERFGETLTLEAPDWWQQVSTGLDDRSLRFAQDVLTAARAAKERLSRYEEITEFVGGPDVDIEITREEYEQLIHGRVLDTVRIMDQTIERAGLTAAQLTGIVLTGGASRTPMVERLLRQRYGEKRVHTRDDPKLAPASERSPGRISRNRPHRGHLRRNR